MQELFKFRSGTHGLKMKSWVGIGEGRARKSVCCARTSVTVFVIHCGIVQHIEVLELNFLLKFQASLGGSYARFEPMSSLDKSSFILGNELWEEHFESLLALVKVYIWEETKSRLYGDQQPRPHSPTGDLVLIAGVNGQNSEGCVREVSLAQVSCILMYVMLLRPHQWVRGRWPWGALSIIIILGTQNALLRAHFLRQTRLCPNYS